MLKIQKWASQNPEFGQKSQIFTKNQQMLAVLESKKNWVCGYKVFKKSKKKKKKLLNFLKIKKRFIKIKK